MAVPAPARPAPARTALPPRVADALADFAARVRRRFGDRVAQVRLFGSCARGDWGPESDVDVLVVVDGLERRERREAWDLATEVHIERLVPVSPLVLSREEYDTLVRREYLIAAD